MLFFFNFYYNVNRRTQLTVPLMVRGALSEKDIRGMVPKMVVARWHPKVILKAN